MNSNQPAHLVLDYRPSEYTGWEWGKTIGGHRSAEEFTLAGRRYQVGLLAQGRLASARDPVYEPAPADPAIAFRRTLESKFGAYYAFRYRDGLTGRDEFRVQCYSVFATPQQLSFGAQLYVVYQPDTRAGDPPAQARLGWIQVARWEGAGSPGTAPYVDNTECPNPFFISGGLISILGTPVFNFDNPVTAQLQQSPAGNAVLSASYLAEVFLARNAGTKDQAGKDVIDIFAGLRYGWQLREVAQ
jgi:hypothetical protein